MRQTKTYSCGPSCILNLELAFDQTGVYPAPNYIFSEQDIVNQTGTMPETGMELDSMVKYIKESKILGSFSGTFGPETYSSGLCIANIKNPLSGGGHFVIIVSSSNDILSIFDPVTAVLKTVALTDMDWSGSDGVRHWSINFILTDNDYNKIVEYFNNYIPPPLLHIITDNSHASIASTKEIEKIYSQSDTTVSTVLESNITVFDKYLRLGAVVVNARDLVLININQSHSKDYITTLQLLSVFDNNNNVRFVNSPKSLCYLNPHLALLHAGIKIGYGLTSHHHEDAAIYFTTQKYPLKTTNCFINISPHPQSPLSILPSHPPIKDKDIVSRIIISKGSIFGIIHRRITERSDSINPSHHQWYINDGYGLNSELSNTINLVSLFMSDSGLNLFELDIVNSDYISAINFTNPVSWIRYCQLSKKTLDLF